MQYKRFEEVPVWQDSTDAAVMIFELTEDPAFRNKGDIANQIQRAGLSMSNNIAEGFERGTTQELITFLYYARGSAGEVRSILAVCQRIKAFAHLQASILALKSKAESISRQLRGWADSLQNTDIRGPRYLNKKSRAGYEQGKRADAFMEKLKKTTEEAMAKRKGTQANAESPKP
jgi:four helix bundle protein